MKLRRVVCLFIGLGIFLASSGSVARGQAAPLQMTGKPAFQGKAYRFDKIADGVYYATATGSMITGGNNTVIVNDRDVLVVDANTTPAAARELLAEIKLITDKPVRWVVDTHFHYDHTDGNMVYGPEVQIIATDYVRGMLANHDVLHTEPYKTSIGTVPMQIEGLKKQAAAEKDAAKQRDLETQIKAMEEEMEQIKETKHSADNDLRQQDDTVSRKPRNTAFVSGPGSHQRRHGRIPTEGKDRLHRRPDGVAPRLHGERGVRRIDQEAGRAKKARL